MKTINFLSIILGLAFLFSCSNKESSSKTDSAGTDPVKDSLATALPTTQLSGMIDDPLDLKLLSLSKSLDFTSGSPSAKDSENYCSSVPGGFYGRYHLIDKRGISNPSLAGFIDIHKPGKMSDWKFSDPGQELWKIHLTSSVIHVWDSISVGLHRSEIEKFANARKGFWVKKGDVFYSCDFNNFSAVFIFKSDTVRELTVTRSCKK